jgi:heme/copper-type cytochrome/quinol oxidase subunit 2
MAVMATSSRQRRAWAAALFCTLALGGGSLAQETGHQRSFAISARKYVFEPARLEANVDDLVRVTLSSRDIAHSFTIDAYRIAKRVGGGQTVTFEFRADQPGTFRIYCNLKQDEQCKQMHGELVVHPRK